MKTLALWLYGIATLVAALGGLNSASLFMGELFYICITVFLGLAQLFLVLFRSASKVRESVVEHRDHKKWIL
jgi:hypothetical protein